MPSNEKTALINDIRKLMSPIPRRQPSYDSYTANKVVDKLLIRLGIIAIVGLLGYIIIRDSTQKRLCRCD